MLATFPTRYIIQRGERTAVDAAGAIAEQHFSLAGQLHVLVNNVGTNIRKPTVQYTAAEFQALISSNISSAFHLTQLCHDMLKAAEVACVLFNSSVAGGPLAMKSGSIYAMTKGMLGDWCLCCSAARVKSRRHTNCRTEEHASHHLSAVQPASTACAIGCLTSLAACSFLALCRLLIVADRWWSVYAAMLQGCTAAGCNAAGLQCHMSAPHVLPACSFFTRHLPSIRWLG